MTEGFEAPSGIEIITPPRLPVWLLLARRLSGAWRDDMVGDLLEEFQQRAPAIAGARDGVVLAARRFAA